MNVEEVAKVKHLLKYIESEGFIPAVRYGKFAIDIDNNHRRWKDTSLAENEQLSGPLESLEECAAWVEGFVTSTSLK